MLTQAAPISLATARRAGRLAQFHVFHLGFPEFSERYNPVGDFGRITEVATRIATQLPAAGNAAAFREFAWRFTNIVSRALLGLGRKPNYREIARYVTDIEPLLIDYYRLWLGRDAPPSWRAARAARAAMPRLGPGRSGTAIWCIWNSPGWRPATMLSPFTP